MMMIDYVYGLFYVSYPFSAVLDNPQIRADWQKRWEGKGKA